MSEPLCAACGHPRDNHPFRHRFVGPSEDDTIKELEAKLAKAVDAMEVCVRHEPRGIYPDHVPNYWLLKTTLEEIKGKKT